MHYICQACEYNIDLNASLQKKIYLNTDQLSTHMEMHKMYKNNSGLIFHSFIDFLYTIIYFDKKHHVFPPTKMEEK